jgi:hypothetical protein
MHCEIEAEELDVVIRAISEQATREDVGVTVEHVPSGYRAQLHSLSKEDPLSPLKIFMSNTCCA